MHKLTRHVRFSINPFYGEPACPEHRRRVERVESILQVELDGANPYASQPPGEGLAIFFELSVGLSGDLDRSTGFVMNVLDIDETVRSLVVPLFAKRIKADFKQGKHISLYELAEVLKSAREKLTGRFGRAVLSELTLKLNPFRKLSLDLRSIPNGSSRAVPALSEAEGEDCKMIYFGEKFEFAAMHRLWNDKFSDERNFALFGKCANPTGHGHNYIIEVTIETTPQGSDFCIGDFEKIVDDEFIKQVDHKNLNVDVSGLNGINPTVENIASFAWDRLVGKFSPAKLHCVTVWETDKTSCSYFGR